MESFRLSSSVTGGVEAPGRRFLRSTRPPFLCYDLRQWCLKSRESATLRSFRSWRVHLRFHLLRLHKSDLVDCAASNFVLDVPIEMRNRATFLMHSLFEAWLLQNALRITVTKTGFRLRVYQILLFFKTCFLGLELGRSSVSQSDEVAVDSPVWAYLLDHLYVSSQNVSNFLIAYQILITWLQKYGTLYVWFI